MKPSKVELNHSNNKYQLMVDNKPFYINGAGVDFGSIKSLADFGGNAFRTWRVNNGEKSGHVVQGRGPRHFKICCERCHHLSCDSDESMKEG